MGWHSLALLGGLLAICIGVTTGKAFQDEAMSSSQTAQPSTPLMSDAPLPTDTPLISGPLLPSGTPLTSDYTEWTLIMNYSEPECIPTDPGRKFPVMCSGQPSNLVRPCDWYGCGCYRCPRGRKYLKGVDVVCSDGSTVYAPFNGTISDHGMCYGDDKDSPGTEGFTFIGSGFCFKIFNVTPDVHDGPVMKGCRLGTLQPMQAQYPRITSHFHVQKCDLSDPTGLLE
ncbi:leukocyte cell-derived chemotaxin-2-like [Lissotriton helveticus]